MTADTTATKKPRLRVPAVQLPPAPEQINLPGIPAAPTSVEDAPLPMPEGAGAPPAAAAEDVTPYRIFVSYIVGKEKFNAQILSTPFEDVDSVGALEAIASALTRVHEGKRITLLFFRAIER